MFAPRDAATWESGDPDAATEGTRTAWARSLARAPETRPADATEQSADRAADAALRGDLPAHSAGAVTAPDAGTPPWGTGRTLSPQERAWHEPRTGADLDEVRVHEGPAPAAWARVLGARAFTFGRDVVLGAGQYSAGTASGQRLMAHELSHVLAGRARTPVLARVALTAADFDALADAIHTAIGAASSDEELIYVALQKLERDPAKIASLKAAYKKLFKTDLLTDLATRLTGKGLGLAKTLLGEKGGLAVAAAAPSKPSEYETLARAIHTALTAKTPNPEAIYAALLPLGNTAAQALKTRYTALFTTDLEADLKAGLSGADLSYALFLLAAPAAATPHTPSLGYLGQPGFGTSATTASAGGGTVSAGTAVPYSFQPKDPTKPVVTQQFGLGYGYSGPLLASTRWLQFGEREIDATTAAGTTPVTADIQIGSKPSYPLTTSASAPSWFVDSDSPTNPFSDETHGETSWRDATSVSVYDAPSDLDKYVQAQFKAGATRVTSRAHFDIYLIRDFAPIFHLEIEIVWTFTAPTKRTTTRTVTTTGAVASLPGPQKKALVTRYPAFAYIQ